MVTAVCLKGSAVVSCLARSSRASRTLGGRVPSMADGVWHSPSLRLRTRRAAHRARRPGADSHARLAASPTDRLHTHSSFLLTLDQKPSAQVSSPLRSPRSLGPSLHLSKLVTAMAGARGCFNCGGFGHQAASCPKAGTPTCYNCGGEGHVSRDCTGEAKPKSCYKCGKEGHLSRDCPETVAAPAGAGYGGSQECYRCGQVGHIARACPQAGTNGAGSSGTFSGGGANKTCYTCGGVGHLSRDCVQGSRCYNCSGIGHMSKDCPQPQRRACYTCGSEGHISRDCPTTASAAVEDAA